jgi:hypothetical protein
MHMLGWITFFALGVAVVAGLSVSLYAALPKTMLAYAERHGRFQGLSAGGRVAGGTRVTEPPAGRSVGTVQAGMA